MNDLYTAAGWINAKRIVHGKAPIALAIGGRGIGKTYGVLSELLDINAKFIYLRRTQTQIDACKIQELSPFTTICRDKGIAVNAKSISKQIAGFYRVDGEKESIIAVGIALSSFATVRGFDASEYDYILFDEFIPERHERKLSHEGEAFLNVVETVNRNRELSGKNPIKVILLSNANTIESPILSAIGAVKPLDKMIRQGRENGVFYDGLLEIFDYNKCVISERKKDTFLYKVSQNKDFSEMSINNSFGRDMYDNVKSMPLSEFSFIVCINSMSIYKHKSDSVYYVIAGERGQLIYNTTDQNIIRGLKQRYFNIFRALCSGRVFFSSLDVKMQFNNFWE